MLAALAPSFTMAFAKARSYGRRPSNTHTPCEVVSSTPGWDTSFVRLFRTPDPADLLGWL
jgi:hypothetical protein